MSTSPSPSTRVGTPDRARLTPEERATELAERFHILVDAPGVRPFQADRLDAWARRGASHTERLAAQFVLGVYNSCRPWKCGKFNPGEAYGVWDQHNWAAFASWVNAPFTL